MKAACCVFEYCNFGRGYLKVSLLAQNGEVQREVEIALEEHSDKAGARISPAAVADRIAHELNLKKIPEIRLALRCQECFKSMLSLPKMPKFRADALLKKEQKERPHPKYIAFTDLYRYDEGFLYSTYYLPAEVIDFFKNVAKRLGSRKVDFMPYGFYLLENLSYEGSYVYFRIRRKVCTMLLVADGELVNTYDFEFESEQDILNRFLLVMSKYEFNFGKKPITRYAMDSDVAMSFGSELGLLRISDSPIRQEGAEHLMQDLAREHGLTRQTKG